MQSMVGRRRVLQLLAALGLAPACGMDPHAAAGDEPLPPWPDGPWNQAPEEPAPDPDGAAEMNIRALMEVLLPADIDAHGVVVAPGAVEAGAMELLSLSAFLPAARALALLPEVTYGGYDDLARFDAAVQGIVSADLDLLAFALHPLTPFRDLTPAEQAQAVHTGMADPIVRPLLRLVRAACFIAFLGALHNDAGLQFIGFPPFEDWDARVASRGYPRTTAGRLVDAQTEDLLALAAKGELDDYTYNEAPAPTEGDDLTDLLDARGDLI